MLDPIHNVIYSVFALPRVPMFKYTGHKHLTQLRNILSNLS